MTVFKNRRSKFVAAGVAALVLAGGGGALAATELSSPSARDSAIISDAAGQLGVQPSALSTALTKALTDEINAEVTAGQITQSQATALEARLASGQVPLFGGMGAGFGRGLGSVLGGSVSAAATYLGLTTAQIQTDLQGGQTLAQIATAQGKTADGLVAALASAEKTKLDSAVTAGTLTAAQETSILSNLQTEITNVVNDTRPAGGFGFGRGFRHGDGFGLGGDLSAAATYLGLTTAQIQTDLQGGQTLAQIATAQGKTADGLVAALASAEKTKLDSAVTAGTLTAAQETSILSNLQTEITNVVNDTRPAGGFGFGRGFRHGDGFGLSNGYGMGGGSAQTSTIPA